MSLHQSNDLGGAALNSISVYPTPGIPGSWNWHASHRGGGQLGTAKSEAEAWDKARSYMAGMHPYIEYRSEDRMRLTPDLPDPLIQEAFCMHGKTVKGSCFMGDQYGVEFTDGSWLVVKIKYGMPQNGGVATLDVRYPGDFR